MPLHSIFICACTMTKLNFHTQIGGRSCDMKPMSSKRMLRIEKKKKKMAALLEISKLNEYDRSKSADKINTDVNNIGTEPSPKRPRTEPFQTQHQTTDQPIINDDMGASGKPKLYGDDFIQLKRALRETTRQRRAEVKFRLREIGETASLAQKIEERIPLFLSDVQHLLLYSQIGQHSPYTPSRWCQLDKYNKLQNTNVLIIENVSLYDFEAHESLFPFMSSKLSHKLEVITPGAYKGDIVQDLATVPLTGTQVRRYINQFGTLEEAVIQSPDLYDRIRDLFPMENTSASNPETDDSTSGDKFPRTHLLLSGWQMVEENFPLPIKGLMESKYAGYVLTKDSYKDATPTSPMFGIDCEMCRTSKGDLELTRVSLVNENYEVIYEELVKPDNAIIDYLTRFSGITPKMMKKINKKLKDVQDDLRRIIPPDAILVGQSLCNDLHALKMMHPYVIDTSVIFNITGDRSRKTKLQVLAREFLDERIQEGRKGHCSIEDSMASLKLTKLKLSHNIHYGDAVMANVASHVKHHPELGHPHFATSMLKQTTKLDKTATIIGPEDITNKYKFYTFKDYQNTTKKIRFLSENASDTVIQKLNESKSALNIAHVRISDVDLQVDMHSVFKQIDGLAQEMHDATSSPGLCIVILGGRKQYGNGCCFIDVKKL